MGTYTSSHLNQLDGNYCFEAGAAVSYMFAVLAVNVKSSTRLLVVPHARYRLYLVLEAELPCTDKVSPRDLSIKGFHVR